MGLTLAKGDYRVRQAGCAADIAAALDLRAQAFREGRSDRDAFDDRATHILIEDRAGTPLAAFRLLMIAATADLETSYSAQSYDLAPLAAHPGPALELGRFCTRSGLRDPDVLRLGWAAITRIAETEGVRLLFGCSSFIGADWRRHRAALIHLAQRALGPETLRPRPRAPERVEYARLLATEPPDPAGALSAMPPLLRSYLGMGGWVSDHAVIDRDLDTCHVFTALDPARIPPARLKALRQLAG